MSGQNRAQSPPAPGAAGRRELDADPYRLMMVGHQQRHVDGGEGSASASDAGSTISTNPNSLYSATATVKFGNVLSLEDFKGCPCPLDDIVEHERRDDRSGSPRSPRSVRVNQSSRAASPVNQDDLGEGLGGEEVVSNPPDNDEDLAAFAAFAIDDGQGEDGRQLQLAMYASLRGRSSPSGGPSGAHALLGRAHALRGDEGARGSGADLHQQPHPAGMSERARGKQPAHLAFAHGAGRHSGSQSLGSSSR